MIRPERAIGTTEPLPDIDLMQDTILYVFDVDRYYNAIWGGTDDKGQAVTVPKKYVVDTAGVMAGGMEDYNSNSSYVFCDLEQLKTLLRKEFRGSVIPGQPTTANGKAYKDIYYTSVIVNVDNMDYVQQVQNEINDMGYQATSNAEWVASMPGTVQIYPAGTRRDWCGFTLCCGNRDR